MDWGHERDDAAGNSDRAPRLSDEAGADKVANLRAVARLARDRNGVRAVIHPHAGSDVEFADELARVVAAVPHGEAGLSIDTGDCLCAGMDPVETLERYADRLDDVHVKDVEPGVFAAVMAERIRFSEACARA